MFSVYLVLSRVALVSLSPSPSPRGHFWARAHRMPRTMTARVEIYIERAQRRRTRHTRYTIYTQSDQGTDARSNAPVARRKDKQGSDRPRRASQTERQADVALRCVYVCSFPQSRHIQHDVTSDGDLHHPSFTQPPHHRRVLNVYRGTGISLSFPALY